jgi:hypothetical protein
VVVGRREELAELWELTLKGRHVILAGEPGIGKSVLLEMLYEGLRSRGDLHVFRVSEERQFKNALLELARCMHERGIFRHPRLSETVVRSMSWEKLAMKPDSPPQFKKTQKSQVYEGELSTNNCCTASQAKPVIANPCCISEDPGLAPDERERTKPPRLSGQKS